MNVSGASATMDAMLLADLVRASEAVRATRSRKAKTAALAEALSRAAPDEVETATSYLSGALRQRRTGLGWRSLSALPAPAARADAHGRRGARRRSRRSAGSPAPGRRRRRAALAGALFGRATAEEQAYLRGLVTGELRQGALDGLMLEAVADRGRTCRPPRSAGRRCSPGSTPPVAAAALDRRRRRRWTRSRCGPAGRSGRCSPPAPPTSPRRWPRPARTAPTVAVDSKLDGIRIQVHKHDGQVHVFTRSLDDITDRVPEVVEAVAALPAHTLVLDGEAIALTADGRARPFQETGARTASRRRRRDAAGAGAADVVLLRPAARRRRGPRRRPRPRALRAARRRCCRPSWSVPRTVTADPDGGAAAVRRGGRGRPRGRRGQVAGRALRRRPPRRRLGQGQAAAHPRPRGARRRVGQRPAAAAGCPTSTSAPATRHDRRLRDARQDVQGHDRRDARLADRAVPRRSRSPAAAHVVHVRPEQVVEIAFDGIQTSTRYPGGHGAAVRPGAALPRRQDRRRGRHGRDGARAARPVAVRCTLDPPCTPRARPLHSRSMRRMSSRAALATPPDGAYGGRRPTPAREKEILAATRALFDARGVRDAQIEDIARVGRDQPGDHLPALHRQGGAVRAHPGRLPRGARRAARRRPTTPERRRPRSGCGRSPRRSSTTGCEYPAFVDCALDPDAAHRPGAARRDQRGRDVPPRPRHRHLPGHAAAAHPGRRRRRRLPHRRRATCSPTRSTPAASAACSSPGSGCSSRRPAPGVPTIAPAARPSRSRST